MKRLALLLGFTLACTTAKPPVADEATRGAIKQLTEAISGQPTNMPWIYVLATYHDRAGETAEVVRWLERLHELGWQNGVTAIDFRNSRGAAFRKAFAKLEAAQPVVSKATVAFKLEGQRDLIPEGIAYDPGDDVFYLTSIYRRKVIRVDRAGRATDFVAEGQDGMLGGLGVKVDRTRNLLWVISSSTKEMRGYVAGSDRSMLAAYDLRNGHLVRKIEATPAVLNDLTILDDGTIFATDMGRHKVVRLAPGSDKFEDWAEDFRGPNGIANDGKNLYVADFRGINRFSLADKSREKLAVDALVNGIDGMLFHEGTLVGIQNSIGKPRVIRVHLGTNHVEVLEARNPLFEIPLTGAIANGEFFFIANPGLRSFDDEGRIWPDERLSDPVMLKIAL